MSTLITDKVDNAAVKRKLDTSAYLPHTPQLAIFTGLLPVCAMGMAKDNLNDIFDPWFEASSLADTQTAVQSFSSAAFLSARGSWLSVFL